MLLRLLLIPTIFTAILNAKIMSHRNNRGYSYEEHEPRYEERKRSNPYDRTSPGDGGASKRNRRGD